jgi:hypothetical protein
MPGIARRGPEERGPLAPRHRILDGATEPSWQRGTPQKVLLAVPSITVAVLRTLALNSSHGSYSTAAAVLGSGLDISAHCDLSIE